MPILDDATLNVTYAGPGLKPDPNAANDMITQQISGAFRVIVIDKGYALLGNGEQPEGRWWVHPHYVPQIKAA